MKPASFELRQARSAAEGLGLLAEHGDQARLLAGGQSLVPMMNFRVARPAVLIDLNPCADLAYITLCGDDLRIGAMTRQIDAQTHPLVREHAPALAAALAHAGPRTVRNRGTIGGTLANGYPTAQLLAVATCLDAQMLVARRGSERLVAAAAFFRGSLTTVLEPDELLREIRIPVRRPGERQAFREGGNHVSGPAMVAVCGAGTRLAVIGIHAVPHRLAHTERAGALALDDALDADLAGGEPDAGDPDIAQFRLTLARSLVKQVIADLHQP